MVIVPEPGDLGTVEQVETREEGGAADDDHAAAGRRHQAGAVYGRADELLEATGQTQLGAGREMDVAVERRVGGQEEADVQGRADVKSP